MAKDGEDGVAGGIRRGRFVEHYGPVKGSSRDFDVAFWQAQGPIAIFNAAEELIRNYLLMRGEDVSKLRIERTLTVIRKA